jgi:hypothetical protein
LWWRLAILMIVSFILMWALFVSLERRPRIRRAHQWLKNVCRPSRDSRARLALPKNSTSRRRGEGKEAGDES